MSSKSTETDATDSATPSSYRGCLNFLAKTFLFFAVIYLLQLLLIRSLQPDQGDQIANALKPFQNHYLSLSGEYFITTEGAVNDYIDNMTAFQRIMAYSPLAGAVWLILVVIISLIPAFNKFFTYIFWVVTVSITSFFFYTENFVPRRKTIFTDTEMVRETTDNLTTTTVRVSYSSIERFEYDFLDESEIHTGRQFYVQIFAILEGKRFIISENQLPINDVRKPTPSPEHQREIEDVMGALQKLAKK